MIHSLLTIMTSIAMVTMTPARYPIVDCPSCLLGLWDEPEMIHNTGTVPTTPGTIKDIYLGIRHAPPFTDLHGIELSIDGIAPSGLFLLSAEALVQEAIRIGIGIAAPADTSATSAGLGGLMLWWDPCLEGDRALVRISLLTVGGPVANVALQVKRMYPTSDPHWHTPIVFNCDADRSSRRVTGGCYLLNWQGAPPLCMDIPIGVQPQNWSGVKALYR